MLLIALAICVNIWVQCSGHFIDSISILIYYFVHFDVVHIHTFTTLCSKSLATDCLLLSLTALWLTFGPNLNLSCSRVLLTFTGKNHQGCRHRTGLARVQRLACCQRSLGIVGVDVVSSAGASAHPIARPWCFSRYLCASSAISDGNDGGIHSIVTCYSFQHTSFHSLGR